MKNKIVNVKAETALSMELEATDAVKKALQNIQDIRDIRVTVVPFDTVD